MRRRFRMTVWPTEVPSRAVIEDVTPFCLDGEILRLDLDRASVERFEIPPELYLRDLYELDCDDPEKILTFVNSYGRLGHMSFTNEGKVPKFDRQIIGLLGIKRPNELKLPWNDWERQVRDKRPDDLETMETMLLFQYGMQHIDAFRAWAQAFRRMTDIYQAYQRRKASENDVAALAAVLSELLEPFHPVVEVAPVTAEDTEFDPFSRFGETARLENILALQLYRHIASKDPYLRCENENCGRLFVRQHGRARHGQNRTTGVRYCTDTCARAQASREYRLRQKTERLRAKED